LAFQRAAFDLATTASYLPSLESLTRNRIADLLYTPAALREVSQGRSSLGDFLGAHAEVRLLGNPEPRRLAEEITALVTELFATMPIGRPTLPERAAVTVESRLRISAVVQHVPRLARAVESVRAREDAWHRKPEEFEDCLYSLGVAHRDFTLAARQDLGYGRPLRRRRWQLWRPRSDWPGGWPGPDAQRLIERDRKHRASRPDDPAS
jgi:hypothetical protein